MATSTTSTSHVFRLLAADDATSVELLGTFGSDADHWSAIPMTKGKDDKHEATVDGLLTGTTYLYKFKVDGEWVVDPNAETAADEAGITNNVFTPAAAKDSGVVVSVHEVSPDSAPTDEKPSDVSPKAAPVDSEAPQVDQDAVVPDSAPADEPHVDEAVVPAQPPAHISESEPVTEIEATQDTHKDESANEAPVAIIAEKATEAENPSTPEPAVAPVAEAVVPDVVQDDVAVPEAAHSKVPAPIADENEPVTAEVSAPVVEVITLADLAAPVIDKEAAEESAPAAEEGVSVAAVEVAAPAEDEVPITEDVAPAVDIEASETEEATPIVKDEIIPAAAEEQTAPTVEETTPAADADVEEETAAVAAAEMETATDSDAEKETTPVADAEEEATPVAAAAAVEEKETAAAADAEEEETAADADAEEEATPAADAAAEATPAAPAVEEKETAAVADAEEEATPAADADAEETTPAAATDEAAAAEEPAAENTDAKESRPETVAEAAEPKPSNASTGSDESNSPKKKQHSRGVVGFFKRIFS
ncbi:hypothetical protein GGI24_001886 [Coemansia furcata]|nr:hypothetical protein GGI24_001886 [Coemansia furcata]